MKTRIYLIFMILLFAFGFIYFYQKESDLGTYPPANTEEEIPEQAIRLRILANSDHPRDQWLKRKVRDAIIQEIKTWTNPPKTRRDAREVIQKRLPQFEKISKQTIAYHGFDDQVNVDFGQVPFPTKIYGNHVYPAGNYEALRITIGQGAGANWWCVLFPPLCFVDMSNGDAVQDSPQEPVLSASLAMQKPPKQEQKQDPFQVQFLFLEKFKKWF